MAKVNFWSENDSANLNKMKELLKQNPSMTNRELGKHFNKSTDAIKKARHRYGILGDNKSHWTEHVLKYIISKRQEGVSYVDIVPLLKEYFNITVTPKRLGEVVRNKCDLLKIEKPKIIKLPTKTIQTVNSLPDIEPVNWKIAKTSIKPNAKKRFKTYLITADHHVPHFNVEVVKSVLKLMDDIRFDGFILLGDYMDMEPISHWLHESRQNKTLENKRMVQDYIEGNKLLDEFDKRLPKGCDKRYFMGNHERWYWDLIQKIPALEGLLDPSIELKLKEREYEVYPVNDIQRIGRLSLCHGQYHSVNYVKKHIDEFKTNVLHADLHSPRMRFETSPAKEIAIAGYCIGCMCDMNPDYMKNKANKWSHGFAVLYMYENGFFDVDLKRIVKGRFIFNNKLYDGNE